MRSIVSPVAVIVLLAGLAAAGFVLMQPPPGSPPEVWVVYAGDPGNPYVDAARDGVLGAARNRTFAYSEFAPATADLLEEAFANAPATTPDLVLVQDSGTWAGAVDRWAAARPGTRFVVIDGEAASRQNVRAVAIAADGVSCLAGVLAAAAADGRPVAILLGMPHPVMDAYRDGFTAGVESIAPGTKVEVRYVGNDTRGYADPAGAAVIAEDLYRNGTAVIYAACGGSSLGVIDAAEERPRRFAIGVDRDLSPLGPDVVLGSAVKHLDGIVQAAIEDGLGDAFAPGRVECGLANGATELVLNPRFAAYGPIVAGKRETAEGMER